MASYRNSVHCTKKESEDLVTFTEEILNRKLDFLCSVHFAMARRLCNGYVAFEIAVCKYFIE